MMDMNRLNYYQITGFEHIYLEDSYVLDIQITQTFAKLQVLAVLTKEHDLYKTPLPNEQYYYVNAAILFSNVKKAEWVKKIMLPIKDASGDIDYGNIDEFYFQDGHYHIIGDWGELDIVSAPPVLDYRK